MAPSANEANGIPGPEAKLGSFEYPPTPYKVLDQYHSQPSKIRVACIGAGATGLCTAYKMERMLEEGSWELTLFEKNDQFGGTWYENTYPGVACDIPTPLYTFSFDPNPNWSHYFAYGPEIQEYFEGFARRYDLEKFMKLNTKVVELAWDKNGGVWNITLEDQVTKKTWYDWAHVCINGTGILNTWKWPDIEGLFDFKGPMMHSAKWDHSVDFKGKTVGVIGTGSTSVQIVPVLQKVAKQVDVFMRSPTWISPPFGATALSHLRNGVEPDPGNRQYKFTEADKKRFRDDPEYFLRFRKEIEAEINVLFEMYISGSKVQTQFREAIEKEMVRRLGPGNEKLKEFLIPKWSVGCRRVSPADGYLEALVSNNVTPVFGEIDRITATGVVVGGEERKLDVLVCATGFTPAFKPAFKVFNGEKTLSEDWGDSCKMYLGVTAPRFPNYFTIVGPGATWSNGTLIPGIETSVEYSIKMIKKIQTEGILSIAVKQEALDDIYEHFDAFHRNTVWSEECRSWFKDGKIKRRIYLWPGPTIHFLKTIKDPRMEDYDIQYRYHNRFAFLGNGNVKATITRDVLALSPLTAFAHGKNTIQINNPSPLCEAFAKGAQSQQSSMSRLDNFDGLFRLDGKVAVITGGSRGLGLHTATAFLRAGAAHVILVARKLDGDQGLASALTALKQEIPGCEPKVTLIPCDLSKFSAVQTLVNKIQQHASKVDILVANAGATWGGPLESTPDESIAKVLDLNVRSVINLARLLGPVLEKSGTVTDPSRIIIVGAIAGFTVPFTGENGTIVYSVSKAAAHHLAKNLAMEFGPRHITCNCVAPGFFPSKLSKGIIGIVGGVDVMKASNPLGRIGLPEDIAGAMIYLCSPAGSFVNGIVLPLDGGNNLQSGLFTKL